MLGQLRELDAHREKGVPADMGWMMYQGDRVHAEEKIDETLGDSAANLRFPSVTLSSLLSAYPGALRHITSAGFEKERTWRKVEGPYTELGHQAVAGNLLLGKSLLERETWVVPLRPDERPDKVAEDLHDVATRYERRYIEAWTGFLADVTVRSPQSLQEAVSLYRSLARPPLPYVTLLRALEDHTQWPITRSERHRDKKAAAAAEKLWRARLPPGTRGILPGFDVVRASDRASVIPSVFAETVAFGVLPEKDHRADPHGFTVAPLDKYVSRLDALRSQIQRLLDEDQHTPPQVVRAQLTGAAREAEALVAAQLAHAPDPDHPDPAKLLLQWLWCPLQVGDVRLPTPRLVPTRIDCR